MKLWYLESHFNVILLSKIEEMRRKTDLQRIKSSKEVHKKNVSIRKHWIFLLKHSAQVYIDLFN